MIEEKGAEIPADYAWAVLRELSGTDLTDHYIDTLRELGKQKGMLGDIYAARRQWGLDM
jgi:type I restriction enzyme M protein